MVIKERIKYLNNNKIKHRSFVVYWMQASQRVEYNHALEYAISRANDLGKPLIVYFGITDNYPEANLRHYQFMIEGLAEVEKSLKDKNIQMFIQNISPEKGAIEISKEADLMVVDRGYLKLEKYWRSIVAENIDIPLVQVETNVIVPIEEVSLKEEYAASTIRNKIMSLLPFYTKPFYIEELERSSLKIKFKKPKFNLLDINKLNIDMSVLPSEIYKGGTTNAKKWLDLFIKEKINNYDDLRNDPSLDYQSHLSPYLHFGQISPLYIYHQVMDLNNTSFIEELIVRRELSMNFVYYNSNYDNYNCLTNWAKETLNKHETDTRPYKYSLEEFENYKTHDIYWNTAQKEMITTGKMSNYMRMYWGKKIIEWTDSPKKAFEIMVYLNNKYSLDGRDANSFTGIAWCFGKHDRPWKERPIFGMIRYMNASGLERKFNMQNYIDKINKKS